jgi:hypothetical protein
MQGPTRLAVALTACAVLATSALPAQEPVAPLRDLVGAKGAGGETEMQNRGYKLAGGSQAGDSSFTYWREPMSNRCVAVRTTDGRYAAIIYTKDADCQGGTATHPPAGGGSGDALQTVCGVETGGKTYRYRCQLRTEGCEGQGYCRSTLTMPDNELKITWRKNDQIEVQSTGSYPQKTTSSFRDGQTRFDYGGNTYFVYRSPDRAKRELANLQD